MSPYQAIQVKINIDRICTYFREYWQQQPNLRSLKFSGAEMIKAHLLLRRQLALKVAPLWDRGSASPYCDGAHKEETIQNLKTTSYACSHASLPVSSGLALTAVELASKLFPYWPDPVSLFFYTPVRSIRWVSCCLSKKKKLRCLAHTKI